MSRRHEFAAWLRRELAPRPGRTAAATRIAVNCAITVAIAMIYEIPLPAYSAYIVLLLSSEEYMGTVMIAVAGTIASTVAVLLSLAFFMIDASEPALRIPLMAVSTFVAMYLVRTSPLGPVAFLAGFVLVLSQTLIDGIPSTERLTRLVLWLWVVVMVPVMLTTAVELALGRSPTKLALQTALRLLVAATAILRGRDAREVSERQAEALRLMELRQHAQMADRRLRGLAEIDHRLIETLVELLTLLHALPGDTPREVCEWLAERIWECRRALASADAPVPVARQFPAALASGLSGETLSIVTAINDAIGRLGADIARRRAGAEAPRPKTKPPLLVADAWSNPDHARFALKTTIAVMAAYFIYTMLDWPGTRTSVTTCFFVALGSLGETMHKLTLRLGGALIGGAAALLSIVYVLPQMTDIGQLALLIAAVSFVSGWVATSSERLSYLGMQMGFAFFLGVLHDYGPTTELTTARDRIVGILLGNVLMTIVFSTMWPVSALDRARQLLGQALGALGELVRNATQPLADARLSAVQKVVQARHFVSIAAFETHLLQRARQRETFEESAVRSLDRLAAAAFVVAAQPSRDVGEAARMQDATASAWFADAARRVAAGEPPAPPRREESDAQAALAPAAPQSLRAAIDARTLLQREMEDVSLAPT
ncbi:MAG TPA: FUSC family protein [Casimicrobiaceae bacterium]|nr:FUSC family protein [Casimicrobiaceae bacterium]